MNWIHDAELFVSSAVEGTYEAVKERTDRLEVNADFCVATFAYSLCFSLLRAKWSAALFVHVFKCCTVDNAFIFVFRDVHGRVKTLVLFTQTNSGRINTASCFIYFPC